MFRLISFGGGSSVPFGDVGLGVNFYENPNVPSDIRERVKIEDEFDFSQDYEFSNVSDYYESPLPLDRILIETDCPYMAPEPYRGRRNIALLSFHMKRFQWNPKVLQLFLSKQPVP